MMFALAMIEQMIYCKTSIAPASRHRPLRRLYNIPFDFARIFCAAMIEIYQSWEKFN